MNPKRLELTPEDLAKVRRAKLKADKLAISPEEAFVAEFGYYFGWEGVLAIENNDIDIKTASKLLRGAQKVWYGKLIEQAYITYTANAAAQSGKKAKQVMRSGLKDFMKEAKVDV